MVFALLHFPPLSPSRHLVIDDRLHFVQSRGEGLELHDLCVLDLDFCGFVEVLRDLTLVQRMDENVEGADTIEEWQVTDCGGDLPHYIADFRLDSV